MNNFAFGLQKCTCAIQDTLNKSVFFFCILFFVCLFPRNTAHTPFLYALYQLLITVKALRKKIIISVNRSVLLSLILTTGGNVTACVCVRVISVHVHTLAHTDMHVVGWCGVFCCCCLFFCSWPCC